MSRGREKHNNLRKSLSVRSIFSHLGLLNRKNIYKFIRNCRIYGFRASFSAAAGKLNKSRLIFSPAVHPLSVPELDTAYSDGSLQLIDRKVSAIIPTKNAGADFHLLLKKLKGQTGLREIEIVIVDSGSSDKTLATAKKENVRVVQIPPEDFNHAYARNKGAECAHGDYLLFMVQDALPLTDRWVYEMVQAIENSDVAAVSCAEYPRSGCDLFYQWVLWNHYRTLKLDRDRVLGWDESCSSYLGLRSNSQINSVAALVKNDVFSEYRFRGKYAEDLDLGVRLIKDGHKLGFLYSTRVLHSHNRPPYYFLKRSYVDTKYLKHAFPEQQLPEFENLRLLFKDITDLYLRTRRADVHLSGIGDTETEQTNRLFERIKNIYSRHKEESVIEKSGSGPDSLETFVGELQSHIGDSSVLLHHGRNALMPLFLDSLESFHDYVSGIHEDADASLVAEIRDALFKLTAMNSGSSIAGLYLTLARHSALERFPSDLDHRLCSGI